MTGAAPAARVVARVRDSFARQAIMVTIAARLERVAPGEVDVALPFRADLTQQDGFLHAGVLTTIVDSACGYAAFTLMPASARVLTVELKLNLLSPARGELFLARGRVLRAGRTLTVCRGDVVALEGGAERLVATMLATLIAVRAESRRGHGRERDGARRVTRSRRARR